MALPKLAFRHVPNNKIDLWLQENGFHIEEERDYGSVTCLTARFENAAYTMVMEADVTEYDKPAYNFAKGVDYNLVFKLYTFWKDSVKLDNAPTIEALERQQRSEIRASI